MSSCQMADFAIAQGTRPMTTRTATSVRRNDDLDLTKAQRAVVDAGHEALAEMKRTANRKTSSSGSRSATRSSCCRRRPTTTSRNGVDLKGNQKGYAKGLRVQAGFGAIDNGAVSKMLTKIMPNLDEIVKWRDTLTADDRFRASAPDTICKKWTGFKIERVKAKVAKAAKLDDPTELVQLKARNNELVEELRSAREAQPVEPLLGQLVITIDPGKISHKHIRGVANALAVRLSVDELKTLVSALMLPDEPTPTKPTKAEKAKAKPSKPKKAAAASNDVDPDASALAMKAALAEEQPDDLTTVQADQTQPDDGLDLPEFLRRETTH
jgi:hypothetical protein